MGDKFIAFFMDEEDICDLCVDFKHGYYDTLLAIDRNDNEIYTTQLSLLGTYLFEMGYKIFVREKHKELFEIKLGTENDRTSREIKMGHNLEKLLIAGEFTRIK